MLKTIRLTPEDVKHFVDVASKCDFDIDICYNRSVFLYNRMSFDYPGKIEYYLPG